MLRAHAVTGQSISLPAVRQVFNVFVAKYTSFHKAMSLVKIPLVLVTFRNGG
jgi:hypothetical protein